MTQVAAAGGARTGEWTRDAPLIRARGLTKRFGELTAVRGIDLEIQAGEAFGFLGRNGAGKTSTMRMIGCVSRPSDGELTVLGMDPRRQGAAIRGRLGVCPQDDNLDLELSAMQNLTTYARYFGIPRRVAARRCAELLEFVRLSERAEHKVDPLSGGMKRRLTIARSLVNDPELVLLDEPTTGLDPQARHLVWERLFQLKRRGVTLVLTTHYMDEAEQLCDRLVIMDDGRIMAEGKPMALIAQHCTKEVVELRFGSEPLEEYVPQLSDVGQRIEVLPDRILLFADDGDAAVALLYERGARPSGVLVRRANLEDVFLQLTGRSLAED